MSMGAQPSAAAGAQRGAAGAEGGREESYARVGNYWEIDDDGVGAGGDDGTGLLPVTKAEASETHAKYLEIKRRHAAEVATSTDIQYTLMGLRQRWGGADSDTAQRMEELRAAHRHRLIAWETELQRVCVHCHEVIENEMAKSIGGHYCHAGCLDAYRAASAPECAYCHKRILKDEHFSGNQMALADGGVAHVECAELAIQAMADTCAMCSERLSGAFELAANGRKVHGECLQKYNITEGLVCLHCGQPFSTGSHLQRVRFEEMGWCHIACVQKMDLSKHDEGR